jgi:hypothetical protein
MTGRDVFLILLASLRFRLRLEYGILFRRVLIDLN